MEGHLKAILDYLLDYFGLEAEEEVSLPIGFEVEEGVNLALTLTQDEKLLVIVALQNNEESVVTKENLAFYFFDDDTQKFLTDHWVNISTSKTSVGFSKRFAVDDMDQIDLLDTIDLMRSEANRLVEDFTN